MEIGTILQLRTPHENSRNFFWIWIEPKMASELVVNDHEIHCLAGGYKSKAVYYSLYTVHSKRMTLEWPKDERKWIWSILLNIRRL